MTPYEVAHPDHGYPAQGITSILRRAEDATYETGARSPHYENEFATLPADRPATPHRTVPRPRIDGLQIAKVAGPQGEEIHTDPFGRVKLTFLWDRRAEGDGTDTGWVRVSQPWGGTTWGHQVIPRVGMEAMVAYREGDPDRPIVVSIVPNPNNPVPYKLPENKTRMVMRSDSYKASGYNEMTFEDQGGQERIHTFAQKDETHRIGNNLTHHVQQDAVNNVGANQSLQVGANMQHNVGRRLGCPARREAGRRRSGQRQLYVRPIDRRHLLRWRAHREPWRLTSMASRRIRTCPIEMSLRLWSDDAQLDALAERLALQVRHLHRRDEPIGAGGRIADRHYASLGDGEATDAAEVAAWIEHVVTAIRPFDALVADLRAERIVGVLWIAILGREPTPTPGISADLVGAVSDLGARIFLENYSTWDGDGNAPPGIWLPRPMASTGTDAR